MYFSRVKPLLDGEHFIVQRQYNGMRKFTTFPSVIALKTFIIKLPQNQRCLYEFIRGNRQQKPHFDIDLPVNTQDPDELMENLLCALQESATNLGFKLSLQNDVVIYTSHGPTKYSFHLILPNHYHETNLEARAFYECVVAKMEPKFAEFVDSRVYSKGQLFRILGCSKEKQSRFKTRIDRHNFGKINYAAPTPKNGTLDQSLCTSIASNAVKIEGLKEPPPKMLPDYPLGERESAAIREFLENHREFCFRAEKGPIIILKRQSVAECIACHRIHESENPFLYANSNGLYFNCRRTQTSVLITQWEQVQQCEQPPVDWSLLEKLSRQPKRRKIKMITNKLY